MFSENHAALLLLLFYYCYLRYSVFQMLPATTYNNSPVREVAKVSKLQIASSVTLKYKKNNLLLLPFKYVTGKKITYEPVACYQQISQSKALSYRSFQSSYQQR